MTAQIPAVQDRRAPKPQRRLRSLRRRLTKSVSSLAGKTPAALNLKRAYARNKRAIGPATLKLPNTAAAENIAAKIG